jgi:hypothetical protein
MEQLFFNTEHSTITVLFFKVVSFFFACALALYLCYFALAKTLFRKSKQRKEVNLRLAFLWAIFAAFMLFNIYLFMLFYFYGIDTLQWTVPKFYLGIFAQILCLTGFIILFYAKRRSLKRNINNNSINSELPTWRSHIVENEKLSERLP